MYKLPIIAAATLAAVSLSPIASAQVAGDPAATTTTIPAQDDDDDFPWGLLGLLGLAGLFGRKRNDGVRTDRH